MHTALGPYAWSICNVVFFPAVFSAGQQTCLVAWTTSTPLDRFAVRLKKLLEKKLHDRKTFWLHLCKLEICTYISLAAIYGLTAITKILVAGWKYARFLCYSMGVRWFLRFLGPKLELPRMSAYSPYLRCLCLIVTDQLRDTVTDLDQLSQDSHRFVSLLSRDIIHAVYNITEQTVELWTRLVRAVKTYWFRKLAISRLLGMSDDAVPAGQQTIAFTRSTSALSMARPSGVWRASSSPVSNLTHMWSAISHRVRQLHGRSEERKAT